MSNYDMYISYSGRKIYKTCPKQYWYRYILKDKTSVDITKTLFGTTIGKVFEWFYEKRIWALPDPSKSLISLIPDAVELCLGKENYVNGSDINFERQLRQDLTKYVPLGLEVIRQNRLLTENVKAEHDLTVVYSPPGHDKTYRLGGIADFVYYFSPNDVCIMDGKAYKQREKYVDSDQLIWYATLHYLKYRVTPNRLGFIYWLFPDNPVSYIDFNSDSMRSLVKDTIDVCQKIANNEFEAKPSGECHRCAFKPKCDEGISYLSKRRRDTGGVIENSIFDLENVTSGQGD
jgi:hypothetical protein